MYRDEFAIKCHSFDKKKTRGDKIKIPGSAGHIFETKVPHPKRYCFTDTKKSATTKKISQCHSTSIFPKPPPLHSFCDRAPKHEATRLETVSIEWILENLFPIVYKEDSIVPIVPFYNSERMIHQTPQALRLFFSASEKKAIRTSTSAAPMATLSNDIDQYPKIPKKKRPAVASNTNTEFSFVHHCKQTASQRKNNERQTISRKGLRTPSYRDKNKPTKTPEKLVVRKNAKAKRTNKPNKDEIERLYCYGLLAVLSTTGFHPCRDVKVRPYCEKIKSIVLLLEEAIQKRLTPDSKYYHNLDFNSLEVKLYHGTDIYRDDDGCLLLDDSGKEIRDDCNKLVNMHNDLVFSDNGVHSIHDTARGDHPICTLTVGATRKLTFLHKWKNPSASWNDGDDKVEFDLDQGSIFCLFPEDEIPTMIDGMLHKTQHGAKFSGKGISIALVFRSVKTTSIFHKKTHRWLWRHDSFYRDRVKEFLQGNSKRFKNKGSVPKEVEGMMENVTRFLNNLRLGERFLKAK